MPYSAVTSVDYQSDRDVYTPSFTTLYGERLPWHHQLDVRIDRRWQKFSAFLDIANVYDNRNAVGWAYNFNFTQRRAIGASPIVPTIGVRGEL